MTVISRRAALGTLAALAAASVVPAAVRAQDATPEPVAPPQTMLPAQPEGQAGQTVTINGADIYYEEYGKADGPAVLLLHGGLGNGDYFVNQIPALTDAYRVVVMDSRGHGRSSFDEQPLGYALMAKDVLVLMDHLAIDQADIVGWSDGGIIGLEIALTQPERLNKVVAYGANYDPTGVRLDIGTDDYFNAYIEAAAADYQTISPDPTRWDEFLGNIGNMWATEPNYTDDQLRTIQTPFLILDGVNEEAIDLNQTKLMAELMPNATLLLMPDTGHFAMFEQPEEFNRIVLDYLAG
ncbi:MAG: alpha/beta fold hydrolase [Chloroflexota bacterium]